MAEPAAYQHHDDPRRGSFPGGAAPPLSGILGMGRDRTIHNPPPHINRSLHLHRTATLHRRGRPPMPAPSPHGTLRCPRHRARAAIPPRRGRSRALPWPAGPPPRAIGRHPPVVHDPPWSTCGRREGTGPPPTHHPTTHAAPRTVREGPVPSRGPQGHTTRRFPPIMIRPVNGRWEDPGPHTSPHVCEPPWSTCGRREGTGPSPTRTPPTGPTSAPDATLFCQR